MLSESHTSTDWIQTKTEIFWGEIAPCDHILQLYENDAVIINSLEGFVTTGLSAGESVIIIATSEHIKALNTKLKTHGFDVKTLIKTDQYIPLNAEEILSRFMVNDWPDAGLFLETVKSVLLRAHGKENRRVRAYGEMVAILWAKGLNGATVHLEHLWNKFCDTEAFCLFCAYPKSGFTNDLTQSVGHICLAHSKIIVGDVSSPGHVIYKHS